MNERARGPWLGLGLVLVWRLALLIFTAQPIPANDAFFFDGAVVNWLLHGQYFNPGLAEAFPISGRQVFAAYPPIYQAMLLPWMSICGTSVLSAMSFHFALFSLAGFLVVTLCRVAFRLGASFTLAVLLLFGITFADRPEDLAHVFGLGALWFTVTSLDGRGRGLTIPTGMALALFCALYTSPVVGAFYCGAAFLTHAAAWCLGRHQIPFAVFTVVVALFAGITFFVARWYPLLREGFLENSRQTPVLTAGFRVPGAGEVLKLVRTAPVFLLAAACLPFIVAQRRRWLAGASGDVPGLSLMAGVGAMGGLLLVASMVLLSPNYVGYVLFAQVLLAAGLLTMTDKLALGGRRSLRVALICCLALVAVRAAGMTTWGVACARDVSHRRAHAILREELEPLVISNERAVVSSAFLYEAARLSLRGAIHSDWPRDRRVETPDADVQALIRLRPPKLVLTQFDFHRSYSRTVEQLRQHPEWVSVHVRDTAGIRTPDSIPALQRVVQHISWAPVIVTLSWK
jgi:hypothetical protein